MKKRLFTMFMVAIMLLSTSVIVSAAEYPSVEAPGFEIISVIDKDGNEVEGCHEIKLKEIEEQDRASVEDMKANLKEVLGDRYVDRLQAVEEGDVYLYDLAKEMEVYWEEGAYHFPVTITFSVPGVKADSVVRVLLGYDGYNDSAKDGEIARAEWHEATNVVVGDGTITITFDYLAPIVFFVQGQATRPDDSIHNTGDDYTALYMVVIAVVLITGACVLKRKYAK